MTSEKKELFSFEKNMRLIDVAFNCVFLTTAEKENVVKIYNENIQSGNEINVTEIFKTEAYVSDKRIEYLLILDEHLEERKLDQQFGRLAVSNGMVSEKALSAALVHQKKFFKDNRFHLRLEEILVGRGEMSVSDRTAVLLTQDRIRNENLLDALNEIAPDASHQAQLNRRFAAIAVKNEIITLDQLKTALKMQADENKKTGSARPIGLILKETAKMSDDDILNICQEQKQFEKRRLDLEKALYTVRDELKISKHFNRIFQYETLKGGLEAVVKKKIETNEPIPVYEFLIWLRRSSIKFGIVDDHAIDEFIRSAPRNTPVMIAKGYPPQPSVNENVRFNFETAPLPDIHQAALSATGESEKEKENTPPDTEYNGNPAPGTHNDKASSRTADKPENNGDEKHTATKADNTHTTADVDPDTPKQSFVKANEILAEILAGVTGKSGRDVMGNPIPAKPVAAVEVRPGTGVVQKGSRFIAKTTGIPVFKNNTLSIASIRKQADTITISGDITDDTGDIYAFSNMEVKGCIASQGILNCHALKLHGDLMGKLFCSRDISISGDIGSKEAQENDHGAQAQIICDGPIKTGRTIYCADIQTADHLDAYNSSILSSKITVFNGMRVKNVLSGDKTPCILQFGLKPGDTLLSISQSIEMKSNELQTLKKKSEMDALETEYETEIRKEENRQMEQAVLKNLIEIINGPEFFQFEGLKPKIDYLCGLPEYSSIKSYYLTMPETKTAMAFIDEIAAVTRDMSIDKQVEYIREKIEPDPENEETFDKLNQIKGSFKTRRKALEQEIETQKQEISQLENELQSLQLLKQKSEKKLKKSLKRFKPVIQIKNKCEKGTLIKGRIASLTIKNDLYNIQFTEVIDPKSNIAEIRIDNLFL